MNFKKHRKVNLKGEEKIKAVLKSGSEQQTKQQNENRFSSSRKNVVGRRKSTIKFDAKPKS